MAFVVCRVRALPIALATVMSASKDLTTEDPFPWLDQSGLAAQLAGSLVVLITFFTSYSHVDIPSHESVAVNQQIGIPLPFAGWRRLLAKLNWHPSLDAQINVIESRRETARLRNETAQL